MKNACKVLAGILVPDAYTGASVRFVYVGDSQVDIDHFGSNGPARRNALNSSMSEPCDPDDGQLRLSGR
jgi:hypothetical protein